ncbi:MAG: hypothetical protein AAGB46_03425, partial [Verrucomicrobiota bacterium]
MGKKKSPFGLLWVVIFFGIIAYKIFDGDEAQNNKPNQSPQTSSEPQRVDVKKDNFIKAGVWPPANTVNSIGVAADQTATNYYVILDASGSMNGMAGRLTKMA